MEGHNAANFFHSPPLSIPIFKLAPPCFFNLFSTRLWILSVRSVHVFVIPLVHQQILDVEAKLLHCKVCDVFRSGSGCNTENTVANKRIRRFPFQVMDDDRLRLDGEPSYRRSNPFQGRLEVDKKQLDAEVTVIMLIARKPVEKGYRRTMSPRTNGIHQLSIAISTWDFGND